MSQAASELPSALARDTVAQVSTKSAPITQQPNLVKSSISQGGDQAPEEEVESRDCMVSSGLEE
jgi:hypothetical protein